MRTHDARPQQARHDDHPPRPPARAPGKRTAQTFVKLLYDCDTTGQVVEHQVPSDARTVKDFWSRTLKLPCPHCGETHDVAFRPAFIRGSLAAGPEALLGNISRD